MMYAMRGRAGTLTARWAALARRQRLGVAVHALAAGLLIPAYLLWAPAPRWDRPELLLVLLAIVVVAAVNEVLLTTGIRLDATSAVALLALVIAGPVPALALSVAQLLIEGALDRERPLLRAGALANLAAFGWDLLAGAAVLSLVAGDPFGLAAAPTVVVAGIAMAIVNYLVGPMVYGTLHLGHPPARMLAGLRDALAAVLAMSALAAVTAVLVGVAGVLALALFAVIAVVPSLVLGAAARARSMSEVDVQGATSIYAEALGDVLRLDRRDRRILKRAAALLAAEPDPHARLFRTVPLPDRRRDRDGFEVALVAAHAEERYDGAGGPAGIREELIPRLSRVLAVACGWAALTAAGTAELSHEEALLDLQLGAGHSFDPAVVDAAAVVVERETRLAPVPAAQPRVHSWPGTPALRARVAPRLLALAHGE
jgi:hypothetical protein